MVTLRSCFKAIPSGARHVASTPPGLFPLVGRHVAGSSLPPGVQIGSIAAWQAAVDGAVAALMRALWGH